MDVDIRFLPTQDAGDILSQIRAIPDVEVLKCFTRAPAVVSRRNPYVRALRDGIGRSIEGEAMSVGRDGASDAIAFLNAGIPAVEFGPLASRGQWERVSGYLGAAAAEGRRPILGDLAALGRHQGAGMAPFVFQDVGRDSVLWREELFGPVMVVEGFADDAEAIALANDTAYGLAATVWTRDLARAQAAARLIRAGEVIVRATAAPYEGPGFSLPQEGRKASGFGAETGIEGLKAYAAWKKVEFHVGRPS